MYSPHTVALPPAALWIDTWQAYPQMGWRWRGGAWVCYRGEGAQAAVTHWNNGADERQESCLGFGEGDYWESRSPVLSRWITQRWGGWRRQDGGGGADRWHKATPMHQWAANCSKVWPTQWQTDTLCEHLYRLVSMRVTFLTDWNVFKCFKLIRTTWSQFSRLLNFMSFWAMTCYQSLEEQKGKNIIKLPRFSFTCGACCRKVFWDIKS